MGASVLPRFFLDFSRPARRPPKNHRFFRRFFFRKNQPGLFFPRRKSRLDNCQKITQTGQIIRNNRVHQNNPPGYFLDFFPRRFFRLKVSGKITRRVIFYLARAKKARLPRLYIYEFAAHLEDRQQASLPVSLVWILTFLSSCATIVLGAAKTV